MLTLSTLPDLYAYSYHKACEATSSLCFRPARADARAPHHLRFTSHGDEPPGSGLTPTVTAEQNASRRGAK